MKINMDTKIGRLERVMNDECGNLTKEKEKCEEQGETMSTHDFLMIIDVHPSTLF